MFDIANVKFQPITPLQPMPLICYSIDTECLFLREPLSTILQRKPLHLPPVRYPQVDELQLMEREPNWALPRPTVVS